MSESEPKTCEHGFTHFHYYHRGNSYVRCEPPARTGPWRMTDKQTHAVVNECFTVRTDYSDKLRMTISDGVEAAVRLGIVVPVEEI